MTGAAGRRMVNIGRDAVEVDTSSADVEFTYETNGLHVGVAGTVKVDMAGGSTVTFTCVAGALYPYAVTKIYKVGTTASLILGIF